MTTIVANNLDGQPDDTLTFTGANFSSYAGTSTAFSDTQFYTYGQTNASNGTFATAEIQDPTANGVLATIPASQPGGSMYLVWPVNSNGVGSPVAINQTDAQWMQPATSQADPAAPGSLVSVYGRNLDNSLQQSWIYLQPTSGAAGQWIAISPPPPDHPDTFLPGSNGIANPYRVEFQLPASLAAGQYQVWVYNGMGGKYGWSEVPATAGAAAGSTFTVGSPTYYPPAWYNVTDYGLSTAAADNGPALQTLLYSITNTGVINTVYFPAGTYNIYTAAGRYPLSGTGQILLPANIRILGEGDSLSVIQFDGSVPNGNPSFKDYLNGAYFDIGTRVGDGANNVELQSIGIVYNGPEISQGDANHSAFVVEEQGDQHLTLDNVAIIGNVVPALDWEGSDYVTVTNSTITSGETYISYASNVVLDNDWFYQVYPEESAAVTVIGGQFISITDCSTENDPITTDMAFGKFIEFQGQMSDVYFANNASYDLSSADDNTGEQVLIDGSNTLADGPILSATANSVTIARTYGGAAGQMLNVTAGPDMGQFVMVASSSYSGTTTTFYIDGNFDVIPNSGSINVSTSPSNMVFYQNMLSQSTTSEDIKDDNASVGFGLGGGHNMVFDGNTVNNTRRGIAFNVSGTDGPRYNNENAPVSFVEVTNNNFNVVQTGSEGPDGSLSPAEGIEIFLGRRQVDASGDLESLTDASFYGFAARYNKIDVAGGTPASSYGIWVKDYSGSATPNVGNFTVLEHNSIFGFISGLIAADEPDALVYKNTFNLNSQLQTGASGIDFNTSDSTLLLQDNNYVGYASIYAGYVPQTPSIDLPRLVFHLTSVNGADASLTFTLENTGAGPVTISVPDPSDPQFYFDSYPGVIQPEQSITITLQASPVDLTEGLHEYSFTIYSNTSVQSAITLFFTMQL